MRALRDARSDWLLKKMPRGLDAKVGRLFEGGHDLSGGEWQRLALARIMYRDADIWILDEPTSSLDPEAEAAIFAELKENLKGRIGIVISHRFSTVRIADRIAVIADGHVTELGTHDELLRAGGRYAQLFELQAAGFVVVFVDYIVRRMQTNCAHVSLSEVSADIIEAATWVRDQPGMNAGRIFVIGWSYGGGGVLTALNATPRTPRIGPSPQPWPLSPASEFSISTRWRSACGVS